jgi:hypothetical protein
LYYLARDEVARVTGQRSPTLPSFNLVDRDQMAQASVIRISNNNLVQRGLYVRNTTTSVAKNIFGLVLKRRTDVVENVLLLSGLSPDAFVATASHELTHDLVAEFYPEVCDAPRWVEEGICQYVAAQVALRKGYEEVYTDIETCPDSDYGDGYRYIKKQAGRLGWAGVVRWIQTTSLSKLPVRLGKVDL